MGNNLAYYEEFAAEYDLFFANLDANSEQEGQWLDEVLCRHGARTVLDASCGTGRQAIPLARRGYQVTASDPSPAMLREARRRVAEAGIEIPFLQCRFIELPECLHRRFDAVITFGNSLSHQEELAEISASLAAMRACCRPQGICLVGIKDFDAIRKKWTRFHGRRIHDSDGERAILFEIWDLQDPLLICTAFALHGGEDSWRVHSAQTRERMLGAEEFTALAHDAGFGSVTRLEHPSEVAYELSG